MKTESQPQQKVTLRNIILCHFTGSRWWHVAGLIAIGLGSQAVSASNLDWGISSAVAVPKVVADVTYVVSGPSIVVSPNNAVMAVWVQSDGTAFHIYAKQNNITDNLAPVVLDTTTLPVDSPKVVADGLGNFIAVWRQAWKTANGARYGIYSSRYTGTWGAPELVYVNTAADWVTANEDMQIAVDPNGNVIVVWSVYDWSWNHTSVRANRYVPGSGWTGVVNMSTEAVQQAFSPNIAMDAAGNAIMVWSQNKGTSNSVPGVHAARYTVGANWDAPTLIGPSAGYWDGQSPQVAFDPSGNAIAIWNDYPKSGARTNRWTVASGWGTMFDVVRTGSGYDEGVRLAIDKSGNTMAVWNQNGGGVFANRYATGTGWGTTAQIESNGNDGSAQVAWDASGNAVAVWGNFSCNQHNIQSSRLMSDSKWEKVWRCYEGQPFSVNSTRDNAGGPMLVIGPAGTATAAWMQSGSLMMATAIVKSMTSQTIAPITFTPSTLTIGGTTIASATATSGLSVTFASATTNTCTIAGSTVTGVTAGTCTITASQVGSSTYSAATPVSQNINIAVSILTRLINLSTRGQVSTGDNVMIGGFIISGSTPKKVLIRAVGPNLANYGVSGVLANPMIELHRSSDGAIVASNDDWGNAANAAEITATTLAPVDAKEAAILTTLDPGAYTAIITGNGGGTGVGIFEVYELDHPETPLLNISTRGSVLTGDRIMIGGFIIQGDAPQTVLIRAVGPTLANYGVSGTIANPTLALHKSSDGSIVASNDDWGSAANAAAITATGLAPQNASESAILITLQPGAYTAVVSGKNGGTGVGIVEVFAR